MLIVAIIVGQMGMQRATGVGGVTVIAVLHGERQYDGNESSTEKADMLTRPETGDALAIVVAKKRLARAGAAVATIFPVCLPSPVLLRVLTFLRFSSRERRRKAA